MIAALLLSLTGTIGLEASDPCEGATTPDVNACLAGQFEKSKQRLDRYLTAALGRHRIDEEAAVRLGITASQEAFETYRSIECATVYENWKGGTIRGAMNLSCEIALTDQRTHTVWQNWLRYMDSTPPILPEPGATE